MNVTLSLQSHKQGDIFSTTNFCNGTGSGITALLDNTINTVLYVCACAHIRTMHATQTDSSSTASGFSANAQYFTMKT